MLKAAAEHLSSPAESGTLFPLEVEGLRFEDRGRTLIDGVTFKLDGRRRTVVIGPNGAGKSLLLRLVHGLLVPQAGTIRWAGQVLDDRIRARQSLVFQRPTMLRRSASDNLRFVLSHLPRGERERRVTDLIAEARLEAVADSPARLLSGGEQQRLAIARARAGYPEVLLLDEPSASLDPASTFAIEEMIRAAHGDGTKIVLVTHDVGQAKRLADDILFISRGRIAEHTDAARFFARPATEAARAYLEGRLDL